MAYKCQSVEEPRDTEYTLFCQVNKSGLRIINGNNVVLKLTRKATRRRRFVGL